MSPRVRQFGDPILRAGSQKVFAADIQSQKVQDIIKRLKFILSSKNLGVGLAAPQIGIDLRIAVICIQPTAHRPKVEPFEMTMINPDIIETFGNRRAMWEGCISGGDGRASMFAQTRRYDKIKLKYLDEKAKSHTVLLHGLAAQVAQHETDHLNGILFVDHVKDTKTYMTYREYMKRIKK